MKKYYFMFSAKAFVLSLVACMALAVAPTSRALTVSSSRDCDDNAIIRCGVLTPEEFYQKYQSTGMGPVYARFGITASEVQSMSNNTELETTCSGVVTKTGNVKVLDSTASCTDFNNKVVATDAITAGRQNMEGSTQESSGGITFYQRPPSVSFTSNSLPAFVVMEKGRFSFAIIASCGNPVKATPVFVSATSAPKSPSPPATTTPTPPVQQPATINITNTNTQSQSQSQAQGGMGAGSTQGTVTSSSQASAPQASAQSLAAAPSSPAPTKSSTSAPSELPNTGPGNVAALSSLSAVFATIGHIAYRRLKQ